VVHFTGLWRSAAGDNLESAEEVQMALVVYEGHGAPLTWKEV
jgi:hypothetical protein